LRQSTVEISWTNSKSFLDVTHIPGTGATPLPAGGYAWPEVAPQRAGAPPTRGPCSA
jgi:hypothetical protein